MGEPIFVSEKNEEGGIGHFKFSQHLCTLIMRQLWVCMAQWLTFTQIVQNHRVDHSIFFRKLLEPVLLTSQNPFPLSQTWKSKAQFKRLESVRIHAMTNL